jgi:hypothetical protein
MYNGPTGAGQSGTFDMSVKGSINLNIAGTPHTVELAEIHATYVVLNMASTPLQAVLEAGQTREFDTNNNGISDLKVEVVSISYPTSAKIKVTVLQEAVPVACGNHICEGTENFVNCPADCTLASATAMFTVQQGSLTTLLVLLLVAALAWSLWTTYKYKAKGKGKTKDLDADTLKEHVKLEISKGHPKEHIYQNLLGLGWTVEQVEKAFKNL